MPTNRRLTLFWAPGGFGKTTVLAECCRVLTRQGIPTAWLSLDEKDDPSVLDAYLAAAFEQAGLDVLAPLRMNDAGLRWPYHPTGVLVRALKAHRGPFVLALDELEWVTDPESVALLNLLVRSDTPGLHLAFACRELPAGLDITEPVYEGDAELITADRLRFSRPEIAQFFDGKLSGRELSAVADDSAGWPIALHIRRSAKARPVRERSRVVQNLVHGWVESRLWYDIAGEDREFLLDVSLLDWIDAELLDEALDGTDLVRRLEALPGTAAQFEPVRRGKRNVWRLHPLIRKHCVNRRRRENPERYRLVNRRIAVVLARRGETVDAMRHAVEAADPLLVGQILMDAGGLRFWLRQGSDRLLAADRLVTAEILARYPRLALARGVAEAMRGNLVEARRVIAAALRELADIEPDGDIELNVDRCLAQALVARNGCASPGSEPLNGAIADIERILDKPGIHPVVCGAFEYGLAMVHNLKAEFDAALDRGARARDRIGEQSDYLRMIVDYELGQIAMAQGRVEDAVDLYGSGLRAAKRQFLQDPGLTVIGEILTRELNLERNRLDRDDKAGGVPGQLLRSSAQFASFAAATGVAAELNRQVHGVEGALAIIEEMLEYARWAEMPSLQRYLAGLRVEELAAAMRIGAAESYWREDKLPSSQAGCLDLGRQSWREMEVVSCARLRLLATTGQYQEGRQLFGNLVDVCAARGLRRTRMRALVLAIVLEEAAGNRKAATDNLIAFLELYRLVDYPRAIVREWDAVVPVLAEFPDANPHSPLRELAGALLAAPNSE